MKTRSTKGDSALWILFLDSIVKKGCALSCASLKNAVESHLVTHATFKLHLEHLWNQVRESSKIALAFKPSDVQICSIVKFLLFNRKSENLKPENLTMKCSKIILNNIISKAPDCDLKKTGFCNSLLFLCDMGLSLLRKQIEVDSKVHSVLIHVLLGYTAELSKHRTRHMTAFLPASKEHYVNSTTNKGSSL